MVIRETDSELEISGSRIELHAASSAIAALTARGRVRFVAEPAADPAPYQRTLGGLEVEASGGPVRVAVVDAVLRVSGSAESLARLAGFFSFPVDAPPSYHTHHDWWPGNEFIAPDSRPLVVRLA